MSELNCQGTEPISKLTNWICYTVLIAMIPILLRFLASISIRNINILSPADFIAFGLVLHISMINALEHMRGDNTWKSICNAISILAMVLYGGLMFALLILESGINNISSKSILTSSIILASCSFILCFFAFYRLSKRESYLQKLNLLNGNSLC
jgi:glucan phosphoethanolaminetransferase (alkaline phosphatase superfamily)